MQGTGPPTPSSPWRLALGWAWQEAMSRDGVGMEPQERSPGLRLVLEVEAAGHDSELDGDEGKIKDDSWNFSQRHT